MVSVVKSDDNYAQLVYIYKFDTDYRTRDITVTLDGTTTVATLHNVWWSDEDISGTSAAIEELYDLGYTFTSSIGNVSVSGSSWNITNIPAGYENLTINITSSSEDVITDETGNLTLITLGAETADQVYDADAARIYMENNGTIRYSFVLDTEATDEIANVSWTETVMVNGYEAGVRDYDQSSSDIRTGNTVYALTDTRYNVGDEVVITVSDLEVTLVKDEVATIGATATLSRDGTVNTTVNAQVVADEDVAGYATFVLQRLADGSDTWTNVATQTNVPFYNDTARCYFTNVAEDGARYQIVVTDVEGLESVATGNTVTFEVTSDLAIA